MDDQERTAQAERGAAFAKALREIDERSGYILTYHAHFETELGRLLAAMLPRGELLARMGFANLVRVFQAAYWIEPAVTDSMATFLRLFNDLRNAVAHGDSKSTIDSLIDKIRNHYVTMPGGGDDDPDASIHDMAADIAGTLGGIIYKIESKRPAFP